MLHIDRMRLRVRAMKIYRSRGRSRRRCLTVRFNGQWTRPPFCCRKTSSASTAAELRSYASRMNTPTVDTSFLVRAPQSAACAGSCVMRRSSTAIGGADHGAPSEARQPSLDWTRRPLSRAGFLAMQAAVPPSGVRTPVVAVEQACLRRASSHSSAEASSLGLCITRRWNGPVERRVSATRSVRRQPAVQRKR